MSVPIPNMEWLDRNATRQIVSLLMRYGGRDCADDVGRLVAAVVDTGPLTAAAVEALDHLLETVADQTPRTEDFGELRERVELLGWLRLWRYHAAF